LPKELQRREDRLEAISRPRKALEAEAEQTDHARGILPFDYRQHFVVSFSLRAFLHFLDLRAKLDAEGGGQGGGGRVATNGMPSHQASYAVLA
jgi:thymidylate synthase ThyX